MERFMKGDVVVVPFPFSDLSGQKRRPALIFARLEGDDCISCQFTTKMKSDSYAISIESEDFSEGGLKHSSNARPNRLFTIDRNIIVYSTGKLKEKKVNEIIDMLIKILK